MVHFIDRGAVLLSARDARALAGTVIQADLVVPGGVHAPILKLAYNVLAGLPSVPAEPEVDPPSVTHDEVRGAKFVGTAVAARILGITARRVCQLAEEGQLPGAKPAGRWQFNLEDIEVFRDYRD